MKSTCKQLPFKLVIGLFLTLPVFLIAFTNCSKLSSTTTPTDAITPQPPDATTSPYLSGIDKKIEFDMTQIEEAGYLTIDPNQTGFFSVGGTNYQYKFFRNLAYKCGRQGYHTFLIFQKNSLFNSAPHWVYQHGGGVGYCYTSPTTGQNVCNTDSSLNEETQNEIFSDVGNKTFTFTGSGANTVVTGIKNTISGNRANEGYRVIAPSMCDHDLYGGFGTPFPNNPHWNGEPQTVDGLLATMAAVTYVSKNFNYNGHTYLHGGSAGSAGAYHLSIGLLNNGIKVNGAILDSMTLGTKRIFLDEKQCTPTAQQAVSLGLTSAQAGTFISEKVGVFTTNLSLTLEQQLGKNGIHYYIVDGLADQYCCGNIGVLPEVTAAGFTQNCEWYYQTYRDILQSYPNNLSRVVVVNGLGHGTTGRTDQSSGTTLQAQLESWFQLVNTNPPLVPF